MTAEQQKKFKYWQWRTIIGTMVGYIFFYLIRKNFSFLMPGLTAEFGISKPHVPFHRSNPLSRSWQQQRLKMQLLKPLMAP